MMKKAERQRQTTAVRTIRLGLASCSAMALALSALSVLGATPAHAELRLCNKTESQVGVAIGYREEADWVTEG